MAKGLSPLRFFMRNTPRKTLPDSIDEGSSGVDGTSAASQSRQPLVPIKNTETGGNSPIPVVEQSSGEPSTPRAKSKVLSQHLEKFPHLENSERHAAAVNVAPDKTANLQSKGKFTWQHRHGPVAHSTTREGLLDLSTPPRPPKESASSDGQATALSANNQDISWTLRECTTGEGSLQSTPKEGRSVGSMATRELENGGSQTHNSSPSKSVSRSLKYGQQGSASNSGASGITSVRSAVSQHVITRPIGYLQAVKGGVPQTMNQNFVEHHFELEEDASFWCDHNVQVIMRTRPISNTELAAQGSNRCLKQESPHTVSWLGQPESRFTFDHVAGETVTQAKLFDVAGLPMVENCMSGYNSCMFAYGQTGSGKTHTMLGDIEHLDRSPSENRGMTPRVFEYLFGRIRKEQECRRQERLKFFCKCSFLEIYNEQITDLLEPSSTNLQMREDAKKGVYVENLSEVEVQCVQDVIQLLLQGAANRKVAATNMNRESSRSHSVFTCVVESKWENNSVTNSRYGRLHLVDLAGSERQKSSGAEGGRLKEAANINKSLSTLGLVIMILVDVDNGKQRHVPYRDSKLTFLLQDSLGGNSKTIIIANVSPSSCCAMETLSTLKFAQRAKFIRNNAVINEDASGDVIALRQRIEELKGEVDRLRRERVLGISSSRVFALDDSSTAAQTSGDKLNAPTVDCPAPEGFASDEVYPNKTQSISIANNDQHLRSMEAVLAGALRREQQAEDITKKLAAEIEQLNRLVRQREEDSQCSKLMLRLREMKIRTLEGVADGVLSAESFFADERKNLIYELELLRARLDRNPELTRFALENIRLMDELRRYQEFCDGGERDVLLEEISGLRSQLLDKLGTKVAEEQTIGKLSTPQKRALAAESTHERENELLRIEVKNYQNELQECRNNLNSCLVANADLARQVDELQATVKELQSERSAKHEEQREIPSLDPQELETRHAEEVTRLQLQLDIVEEVVKEARQHLSNYESNLDDPAVSILEQKLLRARRGKEEARRMNRQFQEEKASRIALEKEREATMSEVETQAALVITTLQSEILELREEVSLAVESEATTKLRISQLMVDRENWEVKKTRVKAETDARETITSEKERTVLSAEKELHLAVANCKEAEVEMDRVHLENRRLIQIELDNKSLIDTLCVQLRTAEEELLKRDRKNEGWEAELLKVAGIMSDWETSIQDAESEWRREKEALAHELTEAQLVANEKRTEAASILQKFQDAQATLKEAEFLVDALVKANENAKHDALVALTRAVSSEDLIFEQLQLDLEHLIVDLQEVKDQTLIVLVDELRVNHAEMTNIAYQMSALRDEVVEVGNLSTAIVNVGQKQSADLTKARQSNQFVQVYQQELGFTRDILMGSLALSETLVSQLREFSVELDELTSMQGVGTVNLKLRSDFGAIKVEMLNFQKTAEEEFRVWTLHKNITGQDNERLMATVQDLQSKNSVLNERIRSIDTLEEGLVLQEQKIAHSLQVVSSQLKAVEKERDRYQTDVVVLNEQLDMAQSLADERDLAAAEARQTAQRSKSHAEEKEEEARILERSVEELVSTVYALETQLGIVRRESERHCVEREALEKNLEAVKYQMGLMQLTIDSQEAQTMRGLQDGEASKTELDRMVIEMKNQQIQARKSVESLQQECAEKDVQLRTCKTYIAELVLGAEKQASENQQKLKTLEAMVEHFKVEERKAGDKFTGKVKGAGSPFKCIGSGLEKQKSSEMDEDLSAAKKRIKELEVVAASRQKEVFMVNTKLAEAESMTHDVIRDLLGVKVDIASYASLLTQQQVQKIAERARRRTAEAQRKEEELDALSDRLNEFIEERESWLDEINRRQAEAVAARVSAEKLRLRDRTLTTENETFREECLVLRKKVTELHDEIKELSGQQNLQQRIHHHAKIKEENNAIRLQNEDLSEKLRRMEILLTRVNGELAHCGTADKQSAFLNFDEEARLQKKLQETEENRLQLAETLIGLCTGIMQAAGMQRTSRDLDPSAAITVLQQLQDRQESLERELSEYKLKARIAVEKRRLSDLRDFHTPVKKIRANTNFTANQQLPSPVSTFR